MSFILTLDNSRLVRDTFPGNVCRLIQDEVDAQAMDPRSKVSTSYQSMTQWAFVGTNPRSNDPTRQFSLFHTPQPHDGNMLYEAGFRIIGILGAHNLSGTGNWDGTSNNACRAINHLEIVPGAFVEQFSTQRSALDNVKELILRSLCAGEGGGSNNDYDPETLFFQRRVFSKVFSGMAESSVLTLADDPSGLATTPEMLNRWRVTSRPAILERKIDGKVGPINHLQLGRGDLVDVGVKIDIANFRRRDSVPATVVHFSFDHVIRLCPAAEQKVRMFVAPVSTRRGPHVAGPSAIRCDEESVESAM